MISGVLTPSRGLLARLLAGVLALLCMSGVPAADQPALLLGVHPYLSHGEVYRRFKPFADYLAQRLGRRVEVRIGRDYDEHIREVGMDRLDIAYLGPVSYVKMTAAYGRKPLLACLERDGSSRLTGNIVVLKNSPLESVADLRGRSFAFGDPASTMSSIVPQAMLAHSGVGLHELERYSHFQGHTNVALAVLTGEADAGAVKHEVFKKFETRGLRSLAVLPDVAEHVFVTRSDMPEAQVRRLRELLQHANQDEQGLAALRAIHRKATALVPVSDQAYDSLRQMLESKRAGDGDQGS